MTTRATRSQASRQPDQGTTVRDGEPSVFTAVGWRDQAEHAAESLSRGSRVVVVGRLQQRAWTEDGSARQVVEVVAEELGPSLRWATARPERASRSTGD
jgi:single-strand DNA-binding protein